MESKQEMRGNIDEGMRVYKEFEPTWDWVPDEDCDTLLLYLPGFKKEQLRVQLTRTRKLIVSGERAIEDNTWSRFRKQFAVSNNCDVNGISARFDAGILYIRQPKQIIPATIVDQELQKPTVKTEEPPKSMESSELTQLPQNTTQSAPNPVIKPSTDELQHNAGQKSSSGTKPGILEGDETEMRKKKDEEINESRDLKKATESRDKEKENNSKSSVEEKKNNYEMGYKRAIGRVGIEVKTWRKVLMIVVVLMVVVLGMYINNVKAMNQPLGLP